MKALGKLLGELVAWRWAPAVGLCLASMFYVLVVVALVPNEIGVPMTNARFTQKLAPPAETPELPTYPTATPEPEMAPPPPAPMQPVGAMDFGRRGFSPPLERPEPPPAPIVAAPVMPSPIPAPQPPPPPDEAPPPPAPPPQEALAQAPAAASAPPAAAPAAPGGVMRSFQNFRGLIPGFPRQPAPTPSEQPAPPAAPPAQ